MHTKFFKIGAAAILIAFLSGVGSGTIALSKPQISRVNGTTTVIVSQKTLSKENSRNETTNKIEPNDSATSNIAQSVDINNDDLSQTTSNLLGLSFNHFNNNYSLVSFAGIPRIDSNLSFSTSFSLNTSPIQGSTSVFINNQPVTSGVSIKIFSLGIPPILGGLVVLDLMKGEKKFKRNL